MAVFIWPSQHPIVAAIVFVATTALATYLAYSRYELEQRRRAFKLRHGCQPATSILPGTGPFGLWNLYKIIKAKNENRLLDLFHERSEQLGRTYVNKSTSKMHVMTNDPENIKAVLATRFDDWGIQSIRHGVFKDFLGRGVFTMDGVFWQHSRAMLRPQFEKSQVSAIDQFEPHVLKLLSCIPADGSTIDLQDLFHKLSMDTSTEFLTGNGTDCLGGDKDADKFQQAFEKAMHEGLRQSLLGVFYYLYPRSRREAMQAIKYAHKAVDGWVKQAMEVKNSSSSGLPEKAKTRGERYVFLNELARHEEVDAIRIRDETLNILLAGRDTTAALLSNLWFNLAREPEVYRKLKAEVDALNGERPSYETLRNMKYIKYAVQETLRLHPPVPFLNKLATTDTLLPHGGGPTGQNPLFIPLGTKINYNTHSLMRQPSLYGPDAATFNPSRWADPSLRPGWNYLPFGGGARVCLGQQYALTETYYVTIRMVQRFGELGVGIEDRDGEKWKEDLAVTCCSGNGVKVGFVRGGGGGEWEVRFG